MGQTWGSEAWHADPAVVLQAVLDAVATTGADAVVVLRPVLGAGERVDDFRVLADTGILARLAGAPAVGRTVHELMPAVLADRVVAGGAAALASGRPRHGDVVLRDTPAGVVPVVGSADHEDVRIADVVRVPVDGLVVVLARDVTEARRAERARAESEERYRRLVEHSSDPILVLSADGTVTYASPAVRVVLHREPAALVGRPVCAIAHPDDAATCSALLDEVVRAGAGASRVAQLRTQDADGDVGWVSVTATNWLAADAVGGVVLNIRDVTEQRAAEQRLQREALQDSLTGLPNRRWFMRALAEAASRSERTGSAFAVLVLDVDDFKRVNDGFGHPTGDGLLEQLADRLTTALRPSDTAARLGGDEFVVIAQDLHGADDAVALAARVLERCTGTYQLAGVPTPISVSVGVAVSSDVVGHPAERRPAERRPAERRPAERHRSERHGGDAVAQVDPDGLFGRADAALYEAKRRGRNRVHVASGPRPLGEGDVGQHGGATAPAEEAMPSGRRAAEP